ncbi:hypothetical protein BaRGS_00023503 [Batillaria attramentaria]|uniref:Uncharacterized protein n=1 Tax=Batillaria attramentaria TaxID=370345 RepID=A0ABD0KE32_9CAEN
MGTGASANKGVGVPANPRVVYSHDLSRKEKKQFRIDAPVLVDMQHGSVRYREADSSEKSRGEREVPHEGTVLDHKDHYFYHTRLNDFGPDADKSQEDSFKFYYVTHGPKRAHGKKLFYVYARVGDSDTDWEENQLLADLDSTPDKSILRSETVLGDLRSQEERLPAVLDVKLTLI